MESKEDTVLDRIIVENVSLNKKEPHFTLNVEFKPNASDPGYGLIGYFMYNGAKYELIRTIKETNMYRATMFKADATDYKSKIINKLDSILKD